MFNACMAFVISLVLLMMGTATYVDTAPQGPIIFFSGFAALMCILVAWVFKDE